MQKPLLVRKLTPHERRRLADRAAHGRDAAQVRKAVAIRMSAERKQSPEIATVVAVHDSQVRRWIHAFNEHGLDSLPLAKSPGRPRKADAEYEAAARDALSQCPLDVGYDATVWTASLLRGHLRNVTHQQVCLRTIYNLLHRLDYRYKRPKLSLKHKQDPKQVARAKRDKGRAKKKSSPIPIGLPCFISTRPSSI